MGIGTLLVFGALAIVAVVATAACGDDQEPTVGSLGTPTNLPPAVPVDDLLLGCAMTEAFSLELPMLAARGQDPIPRGFDAINTGICEFSRPIESIALELVVQSSEFIQVVTLESPATQVRIPLDSALEVDAALEDTIPGDMLTGSAAHRILARAVDGEEVEIWSNLDGVWVLDPEVISKEQAREVLQQVRMVLGDIPLNSPLRTFEPVEWPDASLGCPEPDTAYAQVITPGFRLVFEANGALHNFHTNDDGSLVFSC